MQLIRRMTLAAVLVATMVVSAAMPALAQGMTFGPLGTPVTGATVVGGTFTGAVTVKSFDVRGGRLTAVGTVTGTLAEGGTSTTVTAQPLTLPADVSGSCDGLTIGLGPAQFTVGRTVVSLKETARDIMPQTNAPKQYNDLICKVAQLDDKGAAAQAVAVHLNKLMAFFQ